MSRTPDWEAARAKARAALAAMTDEEHAAITAAAATDPDNPPLTDAELAEMRPADEVVPQLARRRGQRGPGRKPAKVQVALRLDADVLEAWRATGDGWQTRMGETLRHAVGK